MILSSWFNQDLEKTLFVLANPIKELKKPITPEVPPEKKVLLHLSSDQFGLIVRAANEYRIVEAKSMNEVFNTIVPHIATPIKKNLSYNSMRVNTHNAEEKDI